jgi:hypothetical protein
MVHELKVLPEYFRPVFDKRKNFEVRKDDRNFQIGDTLYLKEWSPEKGYTGNASIRIITYILGREPEEKQFVPEGYVILGMR